MKEPLKAIAIPPRTQRSVYPEPFASRMDNRIKRQLGEAFGIKKFGVNLTIIKPGGESALLHEHTKQEEFIYVIQGQPTLVTENGEFELKPGDCIGFIPNEGAHCLVNKTQSDVHYLEMGDRDPSDKVRFPNDDIAADMIDGKWKFTHKDGTSY